MRKSNIAGALIGLVIGSGYVFYLSLMKEGKIEYQKVIETQEVVVDQYEQRVDELIASTTKEWEAKHRNWAEQQITKKIIEENEAHIKKLRQEELSF